MVGWEVEGWWWDEDSGGWTKKVNAQEKVKHEKLFPTENGITLIAYANSSS